MTPYYEHAGITIYHGDCREVIPQLPIVDLLLTDPPYGINRSGMRKSTSSHGGRKAYEDLGWDDAPPSEEEFRLMFACSREQIIWGANYFPAYLPPSMGWLVWDKQQRICGSDAELAFASFDKALRVFTLNRAFIGVDGAQHPTQKPQKLMRWCIQQAPEAKSIVDPYAGSGTTLFAAKELHIAAIGVEIEERYCEIAAKRLSQEVFEFAL